MAATPPFVRKRSHVRRGYNLRVAEQRMIAWNGFPRPNIDPRASKMFSLESYEYRIVIHQGTASRVNQNSTPRHQRELFRPNHALSRGSERRVQRQHLRALKKFRKVRAGSGPSVSYRCRRRSTIGRHPAG